MQENINFIQFLRKEFGQNSKTPDPALFGFDKSFSSQNPINSANPPKLQKVLDEYINDAKGKNQPLIDHELIKKWQSATDLQKKEIISSFIKRHNKASINWKQVDFGKISSRQLSHWQAVLAFSTIFGVFLTSLIAAGNPGIINSVSEKETRFVNFFLAIKSSEPSTVLTKDLAKDELSRFINENSKQLRAPVHRDRKTFSIEASIVRGKVAGAFEEKPSNFSQPEFSFLEKAVILMDKLADKQIEFSIKLGEKINRIFE